MSTPNPQVRLKSILTTEVIFKRENIISIEEYAKADGHLDINVSKHLQEKEMFVFLTVTLTQKNEERTLVEIKVTNAGHFETDEILSEDKKEAFCSINAPAIIFPFIREIIVSLSVKAGLDPILIQPINFVELNKPK
jgi:preprotein translocase subunit SecB